MSSVDLNPVFHSVLNDDDHLQDTGTTTAKNQEQPPTTTRPRREQERKEDQPVSACMRSERVERVFVIFSNVVNKDVSKFWARAQEEMRADPGCFLSQRDLGSILRCFPQMPWTSENGVT